MTAAGLAVLSLLSCRFNHPPDPPEITGGTTKALPDSTCTLHVRASDPDGDSVSIRMSWGDGDTTDWSAHIASGHSIEFSPIWKDTGGVFVRAQAMDKTSRISDWSEPWPVRVANYPFPWRLVDSIPLPSADFLYGLTVTSDGRFVYAPDYTGDTVFVIRTSDNAVVARISMHTDEGSWVRAAAALPDGEYVYCTGYSEEEVAVIRVSDHTVVDSIRMTTELCDVAASPDGRYVFTGTSWMGSNDSSFIWRIRTSDNTAVDSVLVDPEGDAFTCLEIGPDGEFLYAVVGSDRDILKFRTSDLTLVDSIFAEVDVEPPAMAISPDGAYLYFGTTTDGVVVVRTSDGTHLTTLETGFYADGVAVGADGQFVYAVSREEDGTRAMVSIWRTVGWARVKTLLLPEWRYNSLAVSPDGERLYATRSDGVVYVFNR